MQFWKDFGITAAIRTARASAKERGRAVEIWAGAAPVFTAHPDGRLELSGRGES